MARIVALLRGVNVGGSHKLPMTTLRAALEDAGCTDVVTYIQSGNVVLTPPTPAPKDVQEWLTRTVSDVAGFEVPVVARTAADMRRVVERNPYPDASGAQLHVVFFASRPNSDVLKTVDLTAFSPEECELLGSELYLHLPNGMGRAKLPAALEKVGRAAKGEPGTTRNWNTVLKLLDLAS
jgi:uncharacterized protein (DUF1697 family)